MRSGCVRAIHEFCPTYVCAKYWEKHWHEWLMHVLGHLR